MTCECCSDCCPVVVPLTQTTVELAGAGIDVEVETINATTRRITIAAEEAGFYLLKLAFIDNPANPNLPSVIVPTSPGWITNEVVTLADGTYVFDVVWAGGTRTWYIWASAGAGIEVSGPIAFA